MNEIYVCLDCWSIGPLDLHLRCATCESDAVASAQDNRGLVFGSVPVEEVIQEALIHLGAEPEEVLSSHATPLVKNAQGA